MARRFLAIAVLFAGAGLSLQAQKSNLRPTVFAITQARVVPEAGQVLAKANVVIRDGLIEAVGADARIPADALTIDGQGLTVYPGFIDAMSTWGFDPALRRSQTGQAGAEDFASEALAATKADNRKGMTPEFITGTALKADPEQTEAWRKLGFTAHLVAPDGGLIVGQSALVSLSGAPQREAVLRTPVAMHLSFRSPGGADYPRVLMGIIAHCRQTLLDAGHYQRSWSDFERNSQAGRRPPLDPALAALGGVLERKLPVMFEADSKDSIHRVLAFAEEFNLQPIIYGGHDAWKAVEQIKQRETPVLLRLNFAEKPQSRLGRRASAPFYEAASGPDEEKTLPKRVQDDLQQQQKDEQGTAAKLRKEGIRFAFSGQGLEKPEKFRENLRKVIAAGLEPDDALRALTIDAARILGVERQLGTIAAGKAAHLVVTDGDFHEAKSNIRYVFADGVRFEYDKPAEAKKDKPKDAADPKTADEAKKEESKKPKEAKKTEPSKPKEEQAVELEADRKPKTKTGGNVLIRNATVLTVTNGTLLKTDVVVKNGKIAEIGPGLKTPAGAALIDAEGFFVMPGIVDTHCHFAVAGGVNEFSLSVVPEVRVRDVVDSEDVQIYRALAGGVTTARLLHGSANVIGGQDTAMAAS